MAIEQGANAVARDRVGFTRLHLDNWSSVGWFDEAKFKAVSASFENPDWLRVTLHSYRSRWGEAKTGSSKYLVGSADEGNRLTDAPCSLYSRSG
jgi:hypothetical protein